MAYPCRVVLTEARRAGLRTLDGSGAAPARTPTRARVLLEADHGEGGPGWSDAAIAGALDVNPSPAQRAMPRDRIRVFVSRMPRTPHDRSTPFGVPTSRIYAILAAQKERGTVTEPTTLDNQIAWMDAADSRAFFDRQVRARLNVSGEEFLRRLDAGEWDQVIDDPGYQDVLYLAIFADSVR